MLADLWARASATQPPLPWEGSLLLGLVALLVTWSPLGHRVVRHLVTLVHEAGHAAVAALVGRRLSGIRLHSDTSGVTVSRGRPRGPGMVATMLAGYPAPALVGLAGAFLLGAGYAAGVLWALVLTCALVLLLVRNLYGLWVVLVLGVSVALLSWTAPAAALSGTAYLMVWTLLLAAPRAVVDLHRERRGRRGGSDADQLRRLTGVPASVWTAVFWLVTVGALVVGARELVPLG
ncbi:M50 family metallopeptidase [Ornithinimicrobium pratense]|uniref:M50 family metallopeptidase n=1 Tax=Ornithinimicrobium pratense TaxID=2593973 RepID=A0A5J6V9U2_9MICO|nr:M50 family metallopeptidase [Ornithinimicrobium pratense]QFG69953.1 M50 family metallopeptidase [Ornithinimicrobium pratense]